MAELDELKRENEDLKRRIYDLEKENSLLKGKISKMEKIAYEPEEITPVIETPTYSPTTSPDIGEVETISIIEEPLETKVSNESIKVPEIEIPFDFKTPTPTLGGADRPIIEGYSRRICPHCDNDRQMSIQEKIDKTNIIMQYPKIYGKKYVCGQCGTNWIVKND
jgi:hypothetical protein